MVCLLRAFGLPLVCLWAGLCFAFVPLGWPLAGPLDGHLVCLWVCFLLVFGLAFGRLLMCLLFAFSLHLGLWARL